MSADGDTFDIDIYGDEAQDEQSTTQEGDQGAENGFYGEDDGYDYENDGTNEPRDNMNQGDSTQAQKQEQQPSQGVKRKAPSDDTVSHEQMQNQVDPGATAALKLTDLHWWTTEDDIRGYCNAAHAEISLVDISFGEHKANGKSRGEAYLEFSTPAAASAVKNEIEKPEAGSASNGEAKRANPFHVYFTATGNPFKGRDTVVTGKKDYNSPATGRGGAYNSFNNNNNNRGNFGGRGGGFNRGGGGFNRGGGYMNNNMMNNQQWGMNTAVGGGGMGMGFGGNPMMAMGGYGNMGRGGMGMMGRGGFGGMANMGAMMGMGNRGGMMMGGGRGGWGGGNMMGGGMQQGYGGGGFGGGMSMQQGAQGQQQNQPNKRMKAE